MAKLLLINSITKRDVNEINDIVGVFPDEHPFTDREKVAFTILQIPFTVEEVLAKFKVIIYQDNSKKPKTYWRDGIQWKELVKRPKYYMTLKNFNEADLNNLSSKDLIKAKITFDKLQHNIALESDNHKVDTTIKVTKYGDK